MDLGTNVPLRVTRYDDLEEVTKKLGRSPSGGFIVEEVEIGKDLWKFSKLYDEPTKDIPADKIAEAKAKVPWIDGRPYMLKIERDKNGQARKLNYSFENGKNIVVEDRDGNCVADKISEN